MKQASEKLPSLKLLKEEEEKLMKKMDSKHTTRKWPTERTKYCILIMNAILGRPPHQRQAVKHWGQVMNIS